VKSPTGEDARGGLAVSRWRRYMARGVAR
jgi:hypothetical protein